MAMGVGSLLLGDEENTYSGTAITAVWVAKELFGKR